MISLFFSQGKKLLPNYPDCSECWTNNDRNALNLWNTFHPQMQNTSRALRIQATTRPFRWSWGRRKCSNYAFSYTERKKLKFAEVKYSWAMKRWKRQGLLPWTAQLSNSVVSQWLDDDSRKGVVCSLGLEMGWGKGGTEEKTPGLQGFLIKVPFPFFITRDWTLSLACTR